MKKLLTLLSSVTILSGCGTTGPDLTDAPKHYFQQERMGSVLKVSGINEMMLSGSNITVEVSTPLPQLSVYPKSDNAMSSVVSGILSLGRMGLAGYLGANAIDGLSRGPTVITQPEPLILRPEVVTLP